MSNVSKSKINEIKDYILKEDIGEGNFGKVKLGISKTTGEKYAIKIINKDQIKKKMKNKIFRENEVITKFNHINVIFVFEIIEDPENYYIIMEYCKRGELFDYIVDHERLTEEEASIFFYQLINGVEYIHSRGIAHRDLKPENLLLTKDKTLKIIDFGLSHEFDGIDLLKTKCGSPSYASPEILRGKPYDGFKSDIWCCGIILYAMVCGYLPFDGETNKILFKNIMRCEPEVPDYLDDSTQDLIIRILTSDPDIRITIDEIKRHRFYLKGKKLCHIDYKMIEKNVLKKRKNKSSFRLNEDDNTYFIAENSLDYDQNLKNQYIKREEKLINEIINEAEENKNESNKVNKNIKEDKKNTEDKKIIENKENKEDIKNIVNKENINVNKDNKENNKGIIKPIVNKEENTINKIKTLSNLSNKESLLKNNSIGNSSNELNTQKKIRNKSNNENYQNELNQFKDSIENNKKNNSRKYSFKHLENINQMDAIFSSKRLNNNYENLNFNNKNRNNNELNNIIKDKNENIITQKNIDNDLYLENNKNDKFNQMLQVLGKNIHLNTFDNESKSKKIKFNSNKNVKNKHTVQYRSPEKLFLNNYTPTIVDTGNNHKTLSNANNNQLFTNIISGFSNNNNIFNNNYKRNLFFNNFKNQNQNKDLSNENSNIKYNIGNDNKSNFETNNIDSIKNSNRNKNKTLKISKSPDKLTFNSLHQIKLINWKPLNKDTQNLYCNNINININNYNIKQGKNKINDNFTNYLNTDHRKNKFNKKNSITNLHNSKKLYLNTEINKEIPKIKTINDENEFIYKNIYTNNYINKTDGNKDKSLPSKTQENFYKPKKRFNFDKISFQSSYNDNKRIINKKSKIQFKKNLFGIKNKTQNDKLKIRGGSEGKPLKHSLDKFLQTIAANGFYKNRKGNKKIYLCGPINIKVNNNNYNVNHNTKPQYLPIMFKK